MRPRPTDVARVLRAERRGPGLLKREVLDARVEAAEIVRQAHGEAEALRERARAQGLHEGGEQAACELLAIARAREDALQELEPQVVELALMAARHILGRALQTRPEVAAQIAAPLLERVRRARQVVVRVHPDDQPAIEALLEAQRAGTVHVEPDGGLTRGDCVIESDIGTLDARIDVRLAALSRALQAR